MGTARPETSQETARRSSSSCDAGEVGEDVASVSDELSRLLRVLHAVKTHLTGGAAGEDSRSRSADVLLVPLSQLGPLRPGALAELVHADPSTVSRHVASLVQRGLVMRTPDPDDNRAHQLVVTPDGTAAIEALRRAREALLSEVTSGWPAEDVRSFARLLHRFVDDVTDHLPDPAAPASARVAPLPEDPR